MVILRPELTPLIQWGYYIFENIMGRLDVERLLDLGIGRQEEVGVDEDGNGDEEKLCRQVS